MDLSWVNSSWDNVSYYKWDFENFVPLLKYLLTRAHEIYYIYSRSSLFRDSRKLLLKFTVKTHFITSYID